MNRVALLVVASLASAAAGCGLDLEGAALFNSGGGQDASAIDATSGVDAAADASGGADAGASDATASDARPSDGASSGDVVAIDAAPDTGARDSAADASDGGSVSGGRIQCGSGATCDLATEICCKAAGLYGCLLRGITCAGAQIDCDERADCPGTDICCARLDGQGKLQRVSCVQRQACNGNASELCNPDAGTCPNGMVCQPTSSELQGDYDCN